MGVFTSPVDSASASLGLNSNKFKNSELHYIVLNPISVLGCNP